MVDAAGVRPSSGGMGGDESTADPCADCSTKVNFPSTLLGREEKNRKCHERSHCRQKDRLLTSRRTQTIGGQDVSMREKGLVDEGGQGSPGGPQSFRPALPPARKGGEHVGSMEIRLRAGFIYSTCDGVLPPKPRAEGESDRSVATTLGRRSRRVGTSPNPVPPNEPTPAGIGWFSDIRVGGDACIEDQCIHPESWRTFRTICAAILVGEARLSREDVLMPFHGCVLYHEHPHRETPYV